MPDITLCNNDSCYLNYRCYRYIAEPSTHWQSYSYFVPYNDYCCDYYDPISAHKLTKDEIERVNRLKRNGVRFFDSKS